MTGSSWRDGDLSPEPMTRKEWGLIMHLRRLGHGLHLAILIKTTKGKDGLDNFKVQEGLPMPENGEDK